MDRTSLLPVRILPFEPCRKIERSIFFILYLKLEYIVVQIGKRLQNERQLRLGWRAILGGFQGGMIPQYPTGRARFQDAIVDLYTRRREANRDDAVQDAGPFQALLLFEMQELLEVELCHFNDQRLVKMGNIKLCPLTRELSTKRGSADITQGYPRQGGRRRQAELQLQRQIGDLHPGLHCSNSDFGRLRHDERVSTGSLEMQRGRQTLHHNVLVLPGELLQRDGRATGLESRTRVVRASVWPPGQ